MMRLVLLAAATTVALADDCTNLKGRCEEKFPSENSCDNLDEQSKCKQWCVKKCYKAPEKFIKAPEKFVVASHPTTSEMVDNFIEEAVDKKIAQAAQGIKQAEELEKQVDEQIVIQDSTEPTPENQVEELENQVEAQIDDQVGVAPKGSLLLSDAAKRSQPKQAEELEKQVDEQIVIQDSTEPTGRPEFRDWPQWWTVMTIISNPLNVAYAERNLKPMHARESVSRVMKNIWTREGPLGVIRGLGGSMAMMPFIMTLHYILLGWAKHDVTQSEKNEMQKAAEIAFLRFIYMSAATPFRNAVAYFENPAATLHPQYRSEGLKAQSRLTPKDHVAAAFKGGFKSAKLDVPYYFALSTVWSTMLKTERFQSVHNGRTRAMLNGIADGFFATVAANAVMMPVNAYVASGQNARGTVRSTMHYLQGGNRIPLRDVMKPILTEFNAANVKSMPPFIAAAVIMRLQQRPKNE